MEDIMVVRSGGPWVIGKSSLSLKKWTTNLDLLDSIFENVLVWARLLSLPMEYWNEDVFRGLANSFGELLSIDPMAMARKRFLFARIYVGISQNADLPSSIEIQLKLGSWTQAIEFESIPFACFNCRRGGHWEKRYPLNASKEKEKSHCKPKKTCKIKPGGDGIEIKDIQNGEKDRKRKEDSLIPPKKKDVLGI
ncbi:uncharacterized protein LOC131051512 [Cryptomeria japonica]|uniref:uncharacterized protein LOC131051512 n=1 Tax=Cryptomeria japonica TaxID=3369 RepID=UPI0025AD3888|nr:uncharacterized protein LOC131051512 [Cryptomeria japonica]